jgi:TolB-like protein/Tfp pilus assembly protein PilF
VKDDPLLSTAGSIADGISPDWVVTRERLASPQDRELVNELALVARIARECRRLGLEGSVDPDDLPKKSGDRWGHLELREVVGRGAFGIVFRAWDPTLQREVALKLYTRAINPSNVIDEGRKLARVRHPNVVVVHGADVLDGIAGIWMEFVDGRRLDEVVGDHGPFSAPEAALIGLELAGALAAVHAAGLVHRDVKAQNVMREHGGRIVLMDMGASLALSAAPAGLDAVGTPLYMAPELFDHAPATRNTDIYSLGVLLHYLVTAKFPVTARSIDELRAAHRGRQRSLRDARPDLPASYVAIVDRMIDLAPSARYQSLGDVERTLVAFAAKSAPATDRDVPARLPWWRIVAVAAAGALVVAVVWAGVRWRASATNAVPRVLAVLPIQNSTGDKSLDYMADALTDVLIADVGRLHSLRVPSYAAVAPFRDRAQPSATIAAKLHANLLLAGSITASGDRVGISLQLIDPASDRVLWSENISRSRGEVMSAQVEVARMLASHLSLRLTPDENRALALPKIDPQAQDEYMRGLVDLYTQSDQGTRSARGHFERAVALDPSFAGAWGQLALAKLYDVNNTSQEARQAALGDIRAAALRAIDLDPNGAPGYLALGTLQMDYDWDFSAAEASLRRATEVGPSYAIAHQRYALLLAALRRLDESVSEGQTACALEPQVPNRITVLGFLYYYKRDFARAKEYMNQALAIQPDYPSAHFALGRIAAAEGDFPRAIREVNTALGVSRLGGWLAELARLYTQAGMPAEAATVLAEIRRLQDKGLFGPGVDIQVYVAAAAGRLDEAFAALNRAIDARITNLAWIAVDPRADPLRRDPRFAEALKRMGLQ